MGAQNFLRNRKILFQSEDIAISKSRLSQVNITKTSNKSDFLKISFFDFKSIEVSQFSFKCLETLAGILSGSIQKNLALIFFSLSAGRSADNYVLFFEKFEKKHIIVRKSVRRRRKKKSA